MSKNLERTVKKIKYHDTREWCGYLTPAEVLMLLEIGARCTHSDYTIPRLKENIKNGKSNPTWIYFTIDKNSELAKMVDMHQERHTK